MTEADRPIDFLSVRDVPGVLGGVGSPVERASTSLDSDSLPGLRTSFTDTTKQRKKMSCNLVCVCDISSLYTVVHSNTALVLPCCRGLIYVSDKHQGFLRRLYFFLDIMLEDGEFKDVRANCLCASLLRT